MIDRRQLLFSALAAAPALAFAQAANTNTAPNLNLVVPVPPGGSVDQTARLLGEHLEVAQLHVRVGFDRVAVLVGNAHHPLEATHQRTHLGQRLALDRLAHHARRTLRDAATLATHLYVLDHVVLDLQIDIDLVATQRVVPNCVSSRWWQLAAVARCAVMIEDDLAVQIF